MKLTKWLAVNSKGSVRIRETRPNLEWNELCCRLNIEIPDELFKRPTIEASLKIQDIPPNEFNPEVIVNTKELIEQQTGAKIEMRVLKGDDEDDN